ncbi:unnamed protein product [Blepharisma stoltei]|uniref:peptidylprolyl isomerase n=1 Tax=Blepharisma stoltei TaxID=1481888 RepID=A0AAU9JD48_9CILI|nr:unnamed protein product [Blepharisma stoltei]
MFNPAQFEAYKNMMNGSNMKQSADMMSKMTDDQLRQYLSMAGMGNMDPSFFRTAAASMSKMDESTLENMKNNVPAGRFPQQSPPPQPEPPTATVVEATEIKNQGNTYFNQGKYKEAIDRYEEALRKLQKEPLSESAKTLEISCRMNLANCLAKFEDYDQIIEQCKKVLIFGGNAKAYYRYGQALMKKGELKEAKTKLEEAKKLSPSDENITKLLEEVRAASLEASPKKNSPKIEEIDEPVKKEDPKPTGQLSNKEKNRGIELNEKLLQEETKNPPKEEKVPQKEEKAPQKKIIIEEQTEEPPKQPAPAINTPIVPPGNMNSEMMNKGMETLKNMSPEDLERMTSSIKNMDPKFMESMMKSQGLNVSSEQIQNMTKMMSPETIKMMSQMMGSGGFPTAAPQQPGSAAAEANPGMPQINANMVQTMLNNPEMKNMMGQMLGTQFGRSPAEMETVIDCVSKCMNFVMKFVNAYRFCMGGNRKYISSAALVGLFSYWMGWINI